MDRPGQSHKGIPVVTLRVVTFLDFRDDIIHEILHSITKYPGLEIPAPAPALAISSPGLRHLQPGLEGGASSRLATGEPAEYKPTQLPQ